MRFIILLLLFSCVKSIPNSYEKSPEHVRKHFLSSRVPLLKHQSFVISQGAFGKESHNEKGNEYSWDFQVPVGTSVISVKDGQVLSIWFPDKGGGCDPKLSNYASNIKIEHRDGTVAQYVHVKTDLKIGDDVKQGQVIAKTVLTGWICMPHLHFGIYKSKDHLYSSKSRRTLPLLFEGIEGGILKQGMRSSYFQK